MVCFSNPNRSMSHNYYFVGFFVCANLFLLNVLIGFIIDNIVAYLSEDIGHEHIGDKPLTQKVIETIQPILSLFSGFSRNRVVSDNAGILLSDLR